MVQSLREVRDILLHPLKETTYEENLEKFMNDAKQTAPDPMIALVRLQNLVDDYLEWFRDALAESLADEISRQSDEEIFEFDQRHTERISQAIDKTTNAGAKTATRKMLDGWLETTKSLALNVEPNFVLTASQRRRIARWEKAMDIILGQALPERPYPSSRSSVQTPIHKELSSFLPNPSREDEPAWTGHELPEFLQGKRAGYIGLLFRSLIILNEPYTAIVFDLESRFPGISRAEVLSRDDLVQKLVRQTLPLETVKDYQQAEVRTSPGIVSLALLAEPLRVYKQVTSERHDLRREEIEQRIGGGALATFSRLRNTVFHVPDDRIDLLKAESEFHRRASSLYDYREIIGSLLKFYLRNPSVSRHYEP